MTTAEQNEQTIVAIIAVAIVLAVIGWFVLTPGSSASDAKHAHDAGVACARAGADSSGSAFSGNACAAAQWPGHEADFQAGYDETPAAP
jgi:hypothetical protein